MTQNELLDLKRKVDQHEQTIVQLLEIIAATNRRISEISAVHSPCCDNLTLKYPR
ncbi:hypothetical protein [Ornithinibacillus californiensis]|uniref:hypothetical protein n=1 Tax=Ornithinibacillus californiensis TaxID=161536 RepID=UPI0012EE9387|nr:hypothetical protein [Ornithinibacillus californiensis]